jgi:hypothetical protein
MHDNGYAALLSAVAGTVAEMVKTYSTQEAENNVLQHSYMSHLHTWPSCMCMMKKAQMKTVACRIAYWCKNAFFEDSAFFVARWHKRRDSTHLRVARPELDEAVSTTSGNQCL